MNVKSQLAMNVVNNKNNARVEDVFVFLQLLQLTIIFLIWLTYSLIIFENVFFHSKIVWYLYYLFSWICILMGYIFIFKTIPTKISINICITEQLSFTKIERWFLSFFLFSKFLSAWSLYNLNIEFLYLS